MSQPPWMAEAWTELGLAETAGAANNPRVLALFREAGHPQISTDATAWCAAYVGAILARAELAPTGSLRARSYLAWGEPLETPRLGAIAVFSRGSDPALGHVGFWLGETDGRVLILGGNQSNAVTVAAVDRARLLGLRWPANASAPAGATVDTPDADPLFARCLVHVLAMEGGYTDDPYDPGGPTNQGITLAVFARHHGATLSNDNRAALVIRLAAIDAATVRTIYRTRYWRPSRAAEMPPAVALMHFDASVNHGLLGAARILQSVLGVEVDGEIGPLTMAAVRRADPTRLVAAYAEARCQRYRALHHFWRFGAGWLNRVAATERLAATPAFTSSPATPRRSPMTDTSSSTTEPTAAPNKWWGESLTVWGALITAVSTVLPVIGPLVGLDLTPDLIRKLGDQTLVAVQAFGGVVGTLMTILGRARASTPLSRRNMTIQL